MKKHILFLILISVCIVANAQYPRASLWTDAINGFASQDAVNGVQKDVVLFAGSSTFTRWSNLKTDFPNSKVLNRAFGGSMMTDLLYYFNQVVAPYSPRQVVLYEGDNDLYGTSKTPEGFMDDVIAITRLINIYYPNAKILLVSIKPSPSRSSAFTAYQAANLLMKNYADKFDYIDYVDTWTPMLKQDGTPNETLFGSDMLHMNATGYALWKSILEPLLLTSTGEPTNDITIFTESTHGTYHDPSWVNVTAPSIFTTAKAEKISCDSTYFHNGKTSLKIAYQSSTGGDWKACVAAQDWVKYDISQMKELEMYIYAPTKVDSINFPYIYLESGTGTTTEKLRLSKYLTEIPAATWTKLTIPVQDWKAKSPSFTYSNVKTIFFSQLNINSAPIAFYIDDIIYRAESITNNSGSVLIDFGSTNTTTSGNWNNITDHQATNTELIDDQGVKTGATLKVTDPFYNGYNTSGTSSATGDAAIFPSTATSDNFFGHGNAWNATPANPAGIFTISGLDKTRYFSFKIFASRTSTNDNREAKYTITGSETKTATLNAANNTDKIAVIDSILPDINSTITLKCEAGENNTSAEKFYYIGAMKITILDNQTSVKSLNINNFNVFYANDEIHIKNYAGSVMLTDLAGKIIAKKISNNGKLQLKLSKGIYIVNTSIGNAKMMVY